ncbi:CRISPR-associated helicase Cas3' [Faecalicatena contorta]|uniref:CRISPR-associated helicase Cas3' n=1 Tax=Faecalicatena contorta TaxID=39482 RepID=UPI001F359ED9|nr:CRISPR-associated helicase Cas3' [Faecalicatena contorta]
MNSYILENAGEHMEYYAKSKKRQLSEDEKKKIAETLKLLEQELETELEAWEKITIEKEIKKLKVEKGEPETAVTLQQHQEEIVQCAEHFFEQYGSYFSEKQKRLVIEACRIHDWGKANLVFQSKVNPKIKNMYGVQLKNVEQIPHGFLSAATISRKAFCELSEDFEKNDFEAFVTAVFYHHTRENDYSDTEIKEFGQKYYEEHIKQYLHAETKKICYGNSKYLLFQDSQGVVNYQKDAEKWQQYLVIKGLLNKFDYSVSAGYIESEYHPDIEKRELAGNIEKRFDSSQMRPAQKYMKEHKDENLVVIAPTGSGKTEAALLWMNGEKSFYTLPLKVSSNAIYQRIKESYSYPDVTILHSDSMQRYLREYASTDTGGYEVYEKSKMLSQPLTVCTVDQLFKFVYKALGTEIFAATLKYSKVVLDEIQAYSPRVIATIIYGLKTINELGGRFAIITATFPPVLQHFMEEYGLVQGEQYLFQDFSEEAKEMRHMVEIREEEIDTTELVICGEKKKVLVICNTVTRAQEVYSELAELTDNVYLLHSRYIRRDREILEDKIMEFSGDENACGIWVTTQIVEASLDIDFDILYTEMCTADSLLQRMGRCNRKNRYTPKEANIIVIANKNGVGKRSVYEEELYERSLNLLRKYENVILSEKQKIEYINRVYCTEEILKTNYYQEIKKYLKLFDTINPLEYSKREADEKFRDIKSITVVPDIIYRENREIFERGIELFQTPHVSREIKSVFTSKLNSLTLNLNLYSHIKDVDVDTIGQNGKKKICDIHRARMKYEFDINTGRGRGLLLNEKEEEDFIL